MAGPGLGLGRSLVGGGARRNPYLGVVATRSLVQHRQNTFAPNIMSRRAMIARDTISAARLVTGNWFVDEAIIGGSGGTYLEKGTGGAQIRTASIEYPAGTWHQVKWGGSASLTEADGLTYESDDCVVAIPNGATFWVNMYVVNALGCVLTTPVVTANPATSLALGDKTKLNSGVDKTMASFTDDGGGFGADGGYGDAPLAVVGMTKKGAVALPMTSRGEGIYDTIDSTGDLGTAARSVGATNGYIQAGVSGDSITRYVTSSAKRVALFNKYCTHIVFDPTNDSLASLVTLQMIILIALLSHPGLKRFIAIPDPETSSTDNWATTANQTITKHFETSGLNPWLRGVPAPLTAVFDLPTITANQVAEKWNADGTVKKWTFDGTHEQQFALVAIKNSGVIPAAAWQ